LEGRAVAGTDIGTDIEADIEAESVEVEGGRSQDGGAHVNFSHRFHDRPDPISWAPLF
jgi:hypothetical protein